MWGGTEVVCHERPALEREDVILPENVLRDIERHTLFVGVHADALLAARRHLRRGLFSLCCRTYDVGAAPYSSSVT
jgi:hypothetical protein